MAATMKRLCLSALCLGMLALFSGCKIVDGDLAAGSVIAGFPTESPAGSPEETSAESPEETSAESPEETMQGDGTEEQEEQGNDPTPTPTPSPTPTSVQKPSSQFDNGYPEWGGGADQGNGQTFFPVPDNIPSSSSPVLSPLPDPSQGKATTNTSGVSILEGKDLDLSGNLKKAVDAMKQQLKDEKNITNFSLLLVSMEPDHPGGDVRIKLNSSYRNKTAYIYRLDSSYSIVPLDHETDYTTRKLDESDFSDNELELKYGSNIGTFVILFGV